MQHKNASDFNKMYSNRTKTNIVKCIFFLQCGHDNKYFFPKEKPYIQANTYLSCLYQSYT